MLEKFFSFMSFYEQHQQAAPAQSNNSDKHNRATPMSLDGSSYARGNQQQPTFAPYEPQRGSISFAPQPQSSPGQEKTLDALQPPCCAAPPGAELHRRAEPRGTTEPRCPTPCTAPAATAASAASTATAATAVTAATTTPTAAMASPTVLTFDAERRAVDFDVWVDDLQLFLQCDSGDGVSLFDHTSGVSTAPAATADSTVRSQWTTRDAVACLAVRSHLPPAERAHFGQYKTAQSLYDAVVARYSSPATAALSRLMLPYLFPDLAAFATVADLVAHLRTSDAHYRAALPTERSELRETPQEQGQGEQGWWRGRRGRQWRRWRRRRGWRWRWGWYREWGLRKRRWRWWRQRRRWWRQRQWWWRWQQRWCWSRCSRVARRLWW
ncbi:unnamed protein product [Closterium sp. NIES-54]